MTTGRAGTSSRNIRSILKKLLPLLPAFTTAETSITKVTFTRNESFSTIHFVVWQFWGRAAEASWTEKSEALFLLVVPFPEGALLRLSRSAEHPIASGKIKGSVHFRAGHL
jgi:hypothetical protein